MGIRERLAGSAAPLLEPNEQVRHVFLAQEGASPYLVFLSVWSTFFFKYRVVCVTDRAIVVMACTRTRRTPTEVLMRLPRQTLIGPLERKLWAKTMITGRVMYINKGFQKDVAAADAEVAGGPMPQPGAPGMAPPPGMPQPQPQAAPTATQAGWYPDPQVPNQQRWHDGTRWTEHVHTG